MLVDYSLITAAAIKEAVDNAIAEAEKVIASLVAVSESRTFENTIRPLEEISIALQDAYGRGPFLGNVHPDEEAREIAREAEERLEKWQIELIFRPDLFKAVKDFSNTDEAAVLAGEAKRLLVFLLRDFRRAGHELSSDDRAEVQRLRERLVELEVAFQRNIAEYEDYLEVTPEDLVGLPDDFVDRLEAGNDGTLRVSMAYPHVIPFMEQAQRRDLREALSFKFSSRAVETNRPVLEEAVGVRERIAKLFGLNSWAHYQMEEKMAKRPEAVEAFYAELIPPLSEEGTAEIATMAEMLAADTGSHRLQAWDWRYYDTLLRKRDYGVDTNQVAEYFRLEDVIAGMFDLTAEVFGLTYQPVPDARAWHEEVLLYQILDKAGGHHLAYFYADLFPRDGKFSHAAAFPLYPGHRESDGTYLRPVSAIVANLTKPTGDKPSLLQHGEVETLFHEFGHILHMSLTMANFTRFSGANTEWDFVEAPSQIMEEWCWQPEVLQTFARHYATGEPIPEELVRDLVRARHLNVALNTLRQVSFGVFDMGLHGPGDHSDLGLIHERAEAVGLLPPHQGTFFPASFGHLLGGYDAGYYGYLWSKVYGLDMFSRFADEGVTSPDVGRRYRNEILEPGGSLDGDQLLRNFLGREPSNEAFLRHIGIS
ncbi:MAG: Zn-dependent oligopeptidase [Acidimicrobiia bacterium]|nr:Zn-dependent oligopeptidase [Acidimicrobiia bacterium]